MKLESVPCRSFQVVTWLLQIVSGRFLLTVSRFMSFLSCSRLSQVVSCCFLFVVGHFKSFLACCRSFQVVSCSLQVVSACFRSFLARCRSFQVVLRHFRSFRVLVSTNKTHIYIGSFFFLLSKEILGNGRYRNKTKQDSKKFNFLYCCKVYHVYLRHELPVSIYISGV